MGRFEKSEIDPARGQPGPALLGNETGIGDFFTKNPGSVYFRDFRFELDSGATPPLKAAL
jgi:hypothetical protein